MVKKHQATVPCRWCGDDTSNTGTKECDVHWELNWRIRAEPAMAERMLRVLDRKEEEPGK